MRLLGLTGGIGSGKSIASDLLRQRGVALIDTDLIARQLVEPGQPALTEITQRFGPGLLDETGSLRRSELARRVFANESDRKDLEGILHPRIRDVWQAEVLRWRTQNISLGVVVIPLLFETKAADSFDATVCIACTRALAVPASRARSLRSPRAQGSLVKCSNETIQGANDFDMAQWEACRRV